MGTAVLITGMGICSPIGNDLVTVTSALREGRSGISPIESFDCSSMVMQHAGEVKQLPSSEPFPQDLYRIWDRGTRMAMHAAQSALAQAKMETAHFAADRLGVCIGTSGSGQYQNARFSLDRTLPIDPLLVFFLSRNSPHFQSSQVAAQFGIRGPNLAIGAATAGGGIALATALSWLRSDRVDAVLVGGSESFSLLNVLGFDQLGLSLPHSCTPYSGQPGMTFGEGAGYVVLESETSAARRGVTPLARLLSVAIRADGFDPIQFDPSGDGQARAMRAALQDAGLQPQDIDWIRASGTGAREQDLAETLAIKAVFSSTTPISSIEPYVGHANGAGPTIGLVAATLCLRAGFIPATLGCHEPRPGCDLDYVPEGTRYTELRNVLCNTVAFGGTNCALVLQSVSAATQAHQSLAATTSPVTLTRHTTRKDEAEQASDEIVITGAGMISTLGCGTLGDQQYFQQPDSRWRVDDSLVNSPFESLKLGWVNDFKPRQHCPAIALRGLESLTQYAAGAVNLALADAGFKKRDWNSQRFGIVSAIARPSGVVFTRLFTELQTNGFRPLVGRLMLRNGRFMIASQLANWFELRGYSSTISLGNGCGLHALLAAYDQLRGEPALDGLVVVACDELSKHTLQMMSTGGILASNSESWGLYSPESTGIIPGEGAAAIVLERKRSAIHRHANIRAQILGGGLTCDALAGASKTPCMAELESTRPNWESQDAHGSMYRASMEIAYRNAGIAPAAIDQVQGNGSGLWDWDQREQLALRPYLPATHSLNCVNDRTGFCEATSGLFNTIAAIQSLHSPQFSTIRRVMVSASTEQGNNAAVVLGPHEETVAKYAGPK